MKKQDIEALKNKKINIIVCDYGDDGIALLETDPDKSSFKDIARMHLDRDKAFVLKIIELDIFNQTTQDVTDKFFDARPGLSKAQPSNPTNQIYLNLLNNVDLYFVVCKRDNSDEIVFVHTNPEEETPSAIIEKMEYQYEAYDDDEKSHSVSYNDPVMIIKANLKAGLLQNISSEIAMEWFEIHKEGHQLMVTYEKAKKPEDLPEFIVKNHPDGKNLKNMFQKPKKPKRP